MRMVSTLKFNAFLRCSRTSSAIAEVYLEKINAGSQKCFDSYMCAAILCQDSPCSNFVCEDINKDKCIPVPLSNMAIQSSLVVHDAVGRCSARICLRSRTPTDGLVPWVSAQRCSVGFVWLYNSHPGRDSLSWGEPGQGETRRTRNKLPLWPASEDNAIDRGSQ